MAILQESSSRTVSHGFSSFGQLEMVFCDVQTENPNSLRDQGLRSPAFYPKHDMSCFTPSVSKVVMGPERKREPEWPRKASCGHQPRRLGVSLGRSHASRPSQSTASGPTEAHWAFLLWHKRHHQLTPQHRCGTQGPLTEKEMTGPVSRDFLAGLE